MHLEIILICDCLMSYDRVRQMRRNTQDNMGWLLLRLYRWSCGLKQNMIGIYFREVTVAFYLPAFE